MEHTTIPIVIVAALEKTTRAIGYQNKLLWHVPADLKRFKELTYGHPVIMGRKTFASIVAMIGKPLPGRTNIVVTRDPTYTYDAEGVKIAHSLEVALTLAQEENPTEIHIGGGAQLYNEALSLVSRLHLTFFDDPSVVADTFFPDFSPNFTIVKMYPAVTDGNKSYQWIDFERIT